MDLRDTVDLSVLSAEQHAVITLALLGLTERETAAEMTELYGHQYTRDRVHTIKLAACRLLRRRAAELVAA